MAEMYPAPPDIMERITRLINAYHPHLRGARLKVEVRQTVPTIQHMPSWAEVDTPHNDSQAREFDFTLWFALDAWNSLSSFQRDALTDHELCHCTFDERGKPAIGLHSIEEFDVVFERFGLWRPNSASTQAAIDIMQARRGQRDIAQMANGYVREGQSGSTGVGSGYGPTGAGQSGSTGVGGGYGPTGGGQSGSTGVAGGEDALIEKLRMLREKLRAGGFSEVETGRLSDTFLRHWSMAIMEGQSGSTGV